MTSASLRFGEGGRDGELTVRRPTDPAVGEADGVGEFGEQEGR